MSVSWGQLASLAVSGGFGGIVVKVLDYAYAEYRHRREASDTAQQIVDRHLDPILKAADELVGKLRSLALRDFQEIEDQPAPPRKLTRGSIDLTNLLFLFAQFWARVQILRSQSLDVNIGATKAGRSLKSFIQTLESRGVRVVERPLQRGMGESLVRRQGQALSCITYYEFVGRYLSNDDLGEWFRPLQDAVVQSRRTPHRQRLLVYGSVLLARIDTLDPQHLTTSDRAGWPNKLTKRSRRDLKFRVFEVYLPFVEAVEKYTGL
jgi:hypothetical protein